MTEREIEQDQKSTLAGAMVALSVEAIVILAFITMIAVWALGFGK